MTRKEDPNQTKTLEPVALVANRGESAAPIETAAVKADHSGGMFRSLRVPNYRIWASGAIVSNVGTWMQRTAQDWLVLTELTDKSATALGIVTALQFGPQLALLPFTGAAADRFDKRKLLLITQLSMAMLSLGLGLLVITGAVVLWQVYLFAALLGMAAAFDAPARQSFVAELVGEDVLSNAVALNSTSFNAARMIGPAVAGILIALIGTGPVFLFNALTFVAVIVSLMMLDQTALQKAPRPGGAQGQGGFIEGLRYAAARPDLIAVLVMMFLIGTFGLNFTIFIPTMAVSVFGADAGEYGALSSTMAVGSVLGALLAAKRERPGIPYLVAGAAIFGGGMVLAGLSPSFPLFGLALVLIGVAAQTVMTTANGFVQMTTTPAMRGRIAAMFMAITLGGTPLGGPIMGWITDNLGPRWAMEAGALAGIAAAGIGGAYLIRTKRRAHGVRSVGGRPPGD